MDGLYAWQIEALDSWRSQGCLGVVEAVTGTGKTRLGLAAAAEAVRNGERVLVIVPSIELQRQWVAQLRSVAGRRRIGELGGGRKVTFRDAPIIVGVVNSVRGRDLGMLGANSLVIADECHRYGSDGNATALDPSFGRRLGLSATYARSDDGNAVHLEPYFGPVCFRMDYHRAIADGVTARFRVGLVGVPFPSADKHRYDEANDTALREQDWLLDHTDVRGEPFGDFMADVGRLAKEDRSDEAWHAQQFLKAFSERRRILAESPAKLSAVDRLESAFRAADRSIVFTETVESATRIASALAVKGLRAGAIHSGLAPRERSDVLRRFEKGRLQVIVAPRVLDEGVDVPAADFAVIVSASRTERQMIQRMGRVLRRKADGRLARFALLYLEGSSEDPARGAHGAFLDQITEAADEVRDFRRPVAWPEVCVYLSSMRRPTGPQGAVPVVKPTPQRRHRRSAPQRKERSGSDRQRQSSLPPPPSPVKTSRMAQPRQRPRAQAGAKPELVPAMTSSRIAMIYRRAGVKSAMQRSDLRPVLRDLAAYSDDVLIRAMKQSADPRLFEAIARTMATGKPHAPQAVKGSTEGAAVGKAGEASGDRSYFEAVDQIGRTCPACDRLEQACRC